MKREIRRINLIDNCDNGIGAIFVTTANDKEINAAYIEARELLEKWNDERFCGGEHDPRLDDIEWLSCDIDIYQYVFAKRLNAWEDDIETIDLYY